MEFKLHKMHEDSVLEMGESPYEEYVPSATKIECLKITHPQADSTYWELMCHYHMCADISRLRGQGVRHKA